MESERLTSRNKISSSIDTFVRNDHTAGGRCVPSRETTNNMTLTCEVRTKALYGVYTHMNDCTQTKHKGAIAAAVMDIDNWM